MLKSKTYRRSMVTSYGSRICRWGGRHADIFWQKRVKMKELGPFWGGGKPRNLCILIGAFPLTNHNCNDHGVEMQQI